MLLTNNGALTITSTTVDPNDVSYQGGIAVKASTGQVYVEGGSKPEWRGISQGMSLAIQGFNGGVNVWSRTHRTRHNFNCRFKRLRVVIPVFNITGTPLVDTLLTEDYNFQVGFEQGYTNAVTGISPRKAFTFGGSTIAQYLVASPPATGYLISDVLELDDYVEASEFFGLWTTVEAAARAGDNKVPYVRIGSNFLQKYIGVTVAAGVSQIDAGTAFTATSTTSTSSAQSGAANYYTPCMLLVETDSGKPFVGGIGDSITYGTGEGVSGSGSTGDAAGSSLSNAGYFERAIFEKLGFNGVNYGRGSDGNKYLSTAANWQYRRQLLALANHTHILNANSVNDISATITVNGRAVTTAYAKWDVVINNSNIYVAVVAGTSSAVASPTFTTGTYIDGTVVWQWVLPPTGTSHPRGAAVVVAKAANVNEQIRAVTTATIINILPTPEDTSTDSFATELNQTPLTGWGDATTRRGLTYSIVESRPTWLNCDRVFNPNIVLEAGAPNTTSKWVVNGVAYYATYDGTHPNSVGHDLMATTLTADLFY